MTTIASGFGCSAIGSIRSVDSPWAAILRRSLGEDVDALRADAFWEVDHIRVARSRRLRVDGIEAIDSLAV